MKVSAAVILLLMALVLWPRGAEASTTVRVRFTVGGTVVAGAAVIVWGISYGIQSGLADRFPIHPGSSAGPGQFRFAPGSPRLGPKAGLDEYDINPPDLIEIPIVIYRW